jgi:hypothetical protein
MCIWKCNCLQTSYFTLGEHQLWTIVQFIDHATKMYQKMMIFSKWITTWLNIGRNRSNKDQIMGKVFTILHFFPFKLMHATTCNWDPTNEDRLFKNTHFKHCKDSYFWGDFLDMIYFEGGLETNIYIIIYCNILLSKYFSNVSKLWWKHITSAPLSVKYSCIMSMKICVISLHLCSNLLENLEFKHKDLECAW